MSINYREKLVRQMIEQLEGDNGNAMEFLMFLLEDDSHVAIDMESDGSVAALARKRDRDRSLRYHRITRAASEMMVDMAMGTSGDEASHEQQ